MSDDYLILRRLHVQTGFVDSDYANHSTSVALILDVETTGLDPLRNKIIELAMRRIHFTETGIITQIDEPYCWREDPGFQLDPAITKLTGLTNADLAGQKIDDAKVIEIVKSADIIIAHNAAFDRKFFETRLPSCRGLAWACTLNEIDWAARGFDLTGRILGWLLAQAGWFYNRHQAQADVDAVIQLLSHVFEGHTALHDLIETASQMTWHVKAVGAHFDVKESLKERGYRWSQDESVWSREIQDAFLADERNWLNANVYAPHCRPRLSEPSIRAITWKDRYV